MTRVDGTDLLTELGRAPWRFLSLSRVLGTTAARLHDVAAPPTLPPLRAVVRARIGAAAPLSADERAVALDRRDALPDGDRLCPGDYHPANRLLGSAGPVLIDWTNATRGDPMADLARTHLLLRVAAVPAGSAAAVRVLERVGRTLFWRRVLASYRRLRPVDEARLARWELVRVAERLSEGLEDEYPALRAILHRAARPPVGRGPTDRRAPA